MTSCFLFCFKFHCSHSFYSWRPGHSPHVLTHVNAYFSYPHCSHLTFLSSRTISCFSEPAMEITYERPSGFSSICFTSNPLTIIRIYKGILFRCIILWYCYMIQLCYRVTESFELEGTLKVTQPNSSQWGYIAINYNNPNCRKKCHTCADGVQSAFSEKSSFLSKEKCFTTLPITSILKTSATLYYLTCFNTPSSGMELCCGGFSFRTNLLRHTSHFVFFSVLSPFPPHTTVWADAKLFHSRNDGVATEANMACFINENKTACTHTLYASDWNNTILAQNYNLVVVMTSYLWGSFKTDSDKRSIFLNERVKTLIHYWTWVMSTA